MNNNESKEFRLKNGSIIINYIKSFSVTEKTIFALLVIVATITSIIMLIKVSDHFMVSIPKNGGELREGIIGLPHMINPVLAITDVDKDISSLVYSGLMKYDGENLTTDLAESFKVSDDGLTYTFTLRPNIYFHDGNQLTTEDVYFTIQKIQDITLKSPRRSDWNNVTVNIISPREIQFTLKQPYSPFLNNTTIGILPKHIWNNIIDDQFVFSKYNIEPVGSGPYKLKSITKDSSGIPEEYVLIASKDYYNSRAYLDKITFVFFPDTDKALLALEKGTIQSVASLSPKQLQTISKENYTVINTPLPRIFGAFFNQNNNPILADRTVRQALDISIDRKLIVDSALDGYGSQIYSPLPYGLSTATSSNNQITNIELARSILEKSGWIKNSNTGIYEKKGPKNTIQILSFDLVTADVTDLKLTAQIIKDAWTKLGAKIEVKIFDTSELYQNIIRPRKYDILLFGQLIGKDRDLYAFWHSSQRNSPGLNVSMYTNSKADSLLESIRTSGNKKINQDKYNELEKIIKNDIPAVFLYSPNFIYVLPKNIKNDLHYNINITNPSDRWNSITNWYINTEKVWPYFVPPKLKNSQI